MLIIGAPGSIGSIAVQLAKHFGAHVKGVCSTANIELVKSPGADLVIDDTVEDFTTQAKVYDIVFDTVAKSSFAQVRRVLVQGGVYPFELIATAQTYVEKGHKTGNVVICIPAIGTRARMPCSARQSAPNTSPPSAAAIVPTIALCN